MSESSSLFWFAILAKPRQEELAEKNLQNQKYNVFLPRIRVQKRKLGKWQDVMEPLFPRYLFVQMNPNEVSISPIRSTRGVAGMVKFGTILKPVPNSVIEFLKRGEGTADGYHTLARSRFQPGREVEILDGPFVGLRGIYRIPRGKDRALVLIEILGRQNKLTINFDDLEPL